MASRGSRRCIGTEGRTEITKLMDYENSCGCGKAVSAVTSRYEIITACRCKNCRSRGLDYNEDRGNSIRFLLLHKACTCQLPGQFRMPSARVHTDRYSRMYPCKRNRRSSAYSRTRLPMTRTAYRGCSRSTGYRSAVEEEVAAVVAMQTL